MTVFVVMCNIRMQVTQAECNQINSLHLIEGATVFLCRIRDLLDICVAGQVVT